MKKPRKGKAKNNFRPGSYRIFHCWNGAHPVVNTVGCGHCKSKKYIRTGKKEKKSYFHDIVLDDNFYLFFIAGLILWAFKRVADPIFRSLADFRSWFSAQLPGQIFAQKAFYQWDF